PAMPAKTSCTCAPAMRSASSIALRIERVVSSISETTPRRMPVVRAWPTPNTLMLGWRGRSPSTSAMMAVVFADPMSRPATRRSEFIGRSEELSLQPSDHLVSISKVDLCHAHLPASQVGLHRVDLRQPVQRDVLHGPNRPGLQLQYQLVISRTPHRAHPSIQRRHPSANSS